jgi:hypothetical protein
MPSLGSMTSDQVVTPAAVVVVAFAGSAVVDGTRVVVACPAATDDAAVVGAVGAAGAVEDVLETPQDVNTITTPIASADR